MVVGDWCAVVGALSVVVAAVCVVVEAVWVVVQRGGVVGESVGVGGNGVSVETMQASDRERAPVGYRNSLASYSWRTPPERQPLAPRHVLLFA